MFTVIGFWTYNEENIWENFGTKWNFKTCQVSISSTFYVQLFCRYFGAKKFQTRNTAFQFWAPKFCTKNAHKMSMKSTQDVHGIAFYVCNEQHDVRILDQHFWLFVISKFNCRAFSILSVFENWIKDFVKISAIAIESCISKV